jgi:hypothetical protein
MSDLPLGEMSEAEFEALIEGHIARTEADENALPADVFVDVLFERIATQARAPVTLSIDVHGDQLVISPDRESTDVLVQGNEVVIEGRRLVLRLASRAD